MSQPEDEKKKKGRSVGFLLIVTMGVIASCLFLVVRICSGASAGPFSGGR
jgi:hypothetical protein